MLPSLTAGFISGILLGSLIPYFPLSCAVLLFFIAVGAALLERRNKVSLRQATWHYGALLAGILYWALVVNLPSQTKTYDFTFDRSIEMTGRIVAPVQQEPDRLVMIIMPDDSVGVSGRRGQIRLTWRTPDQVLYQGDRVRFQAFLRHPSGSINPGGFDYVTYLERQGISAIATVTGSSAVQLRESGQMQFGWAIWNQFDRWRSRIRLAALHAIPQPAVGLYLGIILGDRGYLDQDLRDQFMVTGTVHLLSISGSHLGLVALLIFVTVKRLLVVLPADWLLILSRRITPTRVASACTIVPVAGYACLAGAELATMRSLLMVVVGLSALWLGRERRVFHALAAAALIIVLHDPRAIFDISFQLSFTSVAAIAGWLAKRTEIDTEVLPGPPSLLATCSRWGGESMTMSGVVTIVTLPFVAYYFNQFPWFGLFSNVLAIPAMGLLLVPIGLAAGVWQIVAGGDLLPLAGLNQWLLEHFVSVIRVLSKFPWVEWHVAAPSIFTMLLFYCGLGLMGRRTMSTAFRWAVRAGVFSILLWWVWSPRLFPDGEHFRVTFLDVGQGDSAVIELPDGQVALIDGGTTHERFDMGRGVVAPFLWNRGIRTIDHIIGTHSQLDHVGGLAWVVRHFSVKNYWGQGEAREEPFYRRLQQALTDRGLHEQVAREGQEILSSGPCRMVVLNPPVDEPLTSAPEWRSADGHGLNNRSVATRLICGRHTMLFAADVERAGLSRMVRAAPQGPTDVLKVPHHGAAGSLNREWLASVRPSYAVFSAGPHNPYKHPAQSVVDTYRSEGITTLRTDRDGGVWFVGSISEGPLDVQRARERLWQSTDSAACLLSCERENWSRIWSGWHDRFR
ncbi:MAG: DNA internalization-related competence protein ComEC/Rec2 [Nitrospira sp.]|nr:DNA internalization-related competence protein ComEC/Rec2 [Nitrospira sp.]